MERLTIYVVLVALGSCVPAPKACDDWLWVGEFGCGYGAVAGFNGKDRP